MDKQERIALQGERRSLIKEIDSWSRVSQFLSGAFADGLDRSINRLIQIENQLEDAGVKIKRYTKRGE